MELELEQLLAWLEDWRVARGLATISSRDIVMLLDYINRLNFENAVLREQVRYRGIAEEQPGDGEEIITIDDNLSANIICYFAKSKDYWIEQGIRWIPIPESAEEANK